VQNGVSYRAELSFYYLICCRIQARLSNGILLTVRAAHLKCITPWPPVHVAMHTSDACHRNKNVDSFVKVVQDANRYLW